MKVKFKHVRTHEIRACGPWIESSPDTGLDHRVVANLLMVTSPRSRIQIKQLFENSGKLFVSCLIERRFLSCTGYRASNGKMITGIVDDKTGRVRGIF
jgi:hypothetical protein